MLSNTGLSFSELKHHLHSPFEKRIIIERTVQYIKDMVEHFDDYFPCKMERCNCALLHDSLFPNTFS
jgi:hypothetical protein